MSHKSAPPRSSILEVHLVRTAGPYILARSGGSLLCKGSDAVGGEADMRRCRGRIASDAHDPQRHRRANFAVTHHPAQKRMDATPRRLPG
jgi:hypothetical protein